MGFMTTGPCGVYVGLDTSIGPGRVDRGLAELEDVDAPNPLPFGLNLGNFNGIVKLPFSIQTGQPIFLGTAERGPRVVFNPRTKPIYWDVCGQQVPTDLLYESEDAFIFAELNRYNEPVLAAVQDRMFASGDISVVRGFDRAESVGTLMKREKRGCYALWLSFPYSRKPEMAAQGMPPAYCFPFAVAVGPDEFDPLGTRVRKVRLVWHALRLEGNANSNSSSKDKASISASVLYFLDPTLLPSSN